MQSASPEYEQLDLDPHKSPDFIIAIAGWPILYSVGSDSYTLPTVDTCDLSTAHGFSTIRKWAMTPSGASAKVKGRPEEGALTIGQLDVEILDAYDGGTRALSDLLSRQAYLEGVSGGATSALTAAVSTSATTIVLTDASSFAAGSVAHIGHEAVKLGSKSGSTFTGCIRGYLLTSATAHSAGVSVYSFKPSLYRSRAFLFKGYRSLTLDKWPRAFGGIVTGEGKMPGKVSIEISSTTWEMYADRRKKILDLTYADGDVTWAYRPGGEMAGGDSLEADFTVDINQNRKAPTRYGNGHYVVQVNDAWFGIKELASEPSVGQIGSVRLGIVKGLSNTDFVPIKEKMGAAFGWTNVDFRDEPPTGSDPIEFLLQLLLSKNGDGSNHPTYDVLESGVGLGIPADMIDVSSFETVMSQDDYDDSARVFFVFTGPVDAKEFIEKELCRPFGWYLRTGNDGRIGLVRPKHPQRFHLSRTNNVVRYAVGGSSLTPVIPSGVRTGAQLATAIDVAMGGNFSVTYDESLHKFKFVNTSTAWSLEGTAASDSIWNTLGFTSDRAVINLGVTATADEERGRFISTEFHELDKDDLWSVTPVDNRKHQIAEVFYSANYDFARECYRLTKGYRDAEMLNLIEVAGSSPYEIESRGLLINSFQWGSTAFTFWKEGSTSCDPERIDVSSSYGLDRSNSWASLFASMLFDRYRHPPIGFKCKLPWKYNRCEVGDIIRLTYDIDGVFTDRERNATTLTSRLFEIVSLRPNYHGGFLEAEFIGFRHVSY